jgi:hypothetical protein
MRLFLYGTLLDPALLDGIAGRAVALTPATLRGWRRVAWRDGRYPPPCTAAAAWCRAR